MKAIVLQENLNKWLGVVGRLVSGRGQLPVLSNVLIEAETDGLQLSVTNLEIGIRVMGGGRVEKTGAVTVPVKSFSEFVASLQSGNVELEAEGDKLKVSSGKSHAVFAGIPASEFPVLPKLGGSTAGVQSKLDKKWIQEISSQVAYCAATDESRPVLTGVRFEHDGDNLIVTATDGFRLSRKTMAVEGATNKISSGMILPSRTIMELAKIVSEGKKGTVDMEVVEENNQVVFGYDNVELISRVLEGNFPDVTRIIPASFKCEVIADRESVTRALKAAAIFARDSANIVKFKISDSIMKIEAAAQQTGESAVEVDVDKKGDDGEIAFNYRYVLDFVNSLEDEQVVMQMNDSLSPGVFKGEKSKGLVHVIMPVRM